MPAANSACVLESLRKGYAKISVTNNPTKNQSGPLTTGLPLTSAAIASEKDRISLAGRNRHYILYHTASETAE